MSDPSDIIEAIDNAVDDWDVSPDAVRWTPEKAPEVTPRSERYLTGHRRDRALVALLVGAGRLPTARNVADLGAAYDALAADE